MKLDSIEDIIEDIRQGKMVILMDDEDRENEGDILIASEKITPESINFMSKEGRGLICLTISEKRAKQIDLAPMVKNNTEQFGTNFTVSIEASKGVTSGITASDRATTISAAISTDAKPADIVSPGHIFPIISRDGGVLVRAGHTEAGCDIARLAGLEPSCAIVEILNPDGTMARRPQLEEFCQKHDIKLGSIADLIKYRLETESLVKRISEQQIDTEFGLVDVLVYQDLIDHCYHYVATKAGNTINKEEPTLVRVHIQNTSVDLFKEKSHDWSMTESLAEVAREEGVFVLIGKPEIASVNAFEDNAVQSESDANNRTQVVGIGSQILQDVGVGKIRLLTSSSYRYHSLAGFGLEIVEYVKK